MARFSHGPPQCSLLNRSNTGRERPSCYSVGKDRRIVYVALAAACWHASRGMLACGMNSWFLRHEIMRITHVDIPIPGMNSCPWRHEFMPRKA